MIDSGVRTPERTPAEPSSHFSGRQAGLPEDLRDARRRDADADACQLTDDPLVPPVGVSRASRRTAPRRHPGLPCGVPKLVSCLQIADFSERAPNFGTPHPFPGPLPDSLRAGCAGRGDLSERGDPDHRLRRHRYARTVSSAAASNEVASGKGTACESGFVNPTGSLDVARLRTSRVA
jgi:hypothetical protein